MKQDQINTQQDACVIALGNFDGVHIGHQALLKQGLEHARSLGLVFMVLLFVPHPQSVICTKGTFCCLTDLNEKKRILQELGANRVLTYPFTKEFAALSPQDFVHNILLPLAPAHLVAGYNYTFGRQARGRAQDLVQMGDQWGFSVDIVPEQRLDGMRISSTDIRQALSDGQVQAAARMLGRPYRLRGSVGEGFQRGRELGFPTANLSVPEEVVVPGMGVYAGHVFWQGQRWNALINIGHNPTFSESRNPQAVSCSPVGSHGAVRDSVCDSEKRHTAVCKSGNPDGHGRTQGAVKIEAHLMDFNGELYGSSLAVDFLARIRSEKKFASGAQLAEQIRMDRDAANLIFNTYE
jgi:riboflavin kinase/FMN adenylyltransferase